MGLFQRRSIEDYADSLAQYLPGGRLFDARSIRDSNFRKLLIGVATELYRANGSLINYSNEIIPNKTIKFIAEWENAIGIPDSCFSGIGDIDKRRRDVLIKLAALGIQTEDDFIALAEMFGIPISIESGSVSGAFPMTFPLIFFDSGVEARHTIIINITDVVGVKFPYTFPIQFGTEDSGLIECLFKKLKPANCNLIIRQV